MIQIDSEFQSLIPPLTDDEFKRLEKSILAEGVRESIITWNGTIIDGHNRYRICQEHGLECPHTDRSFDSRDAAKIWIIENQFGRRNLSKYDRSVLALQLEGMYADEAKKRMLAGKADPVQNSSQGTETGKTRDKVAAVAGVSHDTLRKVKIIENEANSGNETAIAARESVKSGSKSIHKAFKEIRHNGDKTDTRNICSVCGKPIDDGDCYDHDRFKHKGCQYKLDKRKHPKTTDDGRRICSHCGKPINDGEAYASNPNMHRRCRDERLNNTRYKNPDISLIENVAVYNIESLLTELTASANGLRNSWAQSIEVNESMGAKLSIVDKKRLKNAANNLIEVINAIRKRTA